MGNKGSTNNSADDDAKYNELTQEQEQEQEQLKLLEESVKKYKEEIENNKSNLSTARMLEMFADLLQSPRLSDVGTMVQHTKSNWKNILDGLRKHSDLFSAETIDEVRDVHSGYWDLLLRTRRVVELLVKQSKIQQRNVKRLLKLMEKYEDEEEEEEEEEVPIALSARDQITYTESASNLSAWLVSEQLVKLLEDWNTMSKRLKKMKTAWKDAAGSMDAKKKAKYLKIAKYFGIAIGVGCAIGVVVAICVLTAGAATPAVAAAGAATLTAAETAGVAATGAIVALSLTGAGVAAAGVATSYASYKLATDEAINTWKLASQVTNTLKEMLVNSLQISKALNVQVATNDKMRLEAESLNSKSLAIMKEALKGIGDHLAEYIKQGEKVIAHVNQASRDYIKSVS